MAARNRIFGIAMAIAALASASTASAADPRLGRTATEQEVAGWNIDVFPDGKGYPQGRGSVVNGEKIYQNSCAGCHGVKLEGGFGPALTGGSGSLTTAKPQKTVGSYWPYASTVFDYIRRSMPFQAPQSLSNDDVYSVTGYILHVNGLMKQDQAVDADSLKAVRMPNRDAFYVDHRPDAKNARCMSNCLREQAKPAQ